MWRPPRRWARGPVLLLLVVALGACAADTGPTEVSAGQEASDPSTPVPSPSADPSPSTDTTSAADPEATPDPTTSTTQAATGGDPGPSPVDGLDAGQLREAVTAPPSPEARRAAGPVAEAVTLADGTTVWRIRIPGDFPLRGAQAIVAVGGRPIGPAASPPSLDALVAVTMSADGLVAGAPVTHQWGRAAPIEDGALVVLR